MELSDLSYYRSGNLLGPDYSLTVVRDSPETDAQWLFSSLLDTSSLFIAFTNATSVSNAKSQAKYQVMDLSNDLFQKRNGKFVAQDLTGLVTRIKSLGPKRVILEHPDILCSSGLVQASELLGFIHHILDFAQVVVSVRVSSALLDSPLGISVQLNYFVTNLLHQSNLVLGINPLSTGRADDYDGSFSVAPGPRTTGGEVAESRYLFTIKSNTVALTTI